MWYGVACVQSEIVEERGQVRGEERERERGQVREEERERTSEGRKWSTNRRQDSCSCHLSTTNSSRHMWESTKVLLYKFYPSSRHTYIRAPSTSDTERRERERERGGGGRGRKIKSAVNETTHYKFTSSPVRPFTCHTQWQSHYSHTSHNLATKNLTSFSRYKPSHTHTGR